MPIKIHFRLLLFLITGFIIFTPFGTLLHECGHIFIAKLFGYHSHLGYGYMQVINDENVSAKQGLLIRMGGPLQTMLTGTVALVLLFFYHRKHPLINTKKWLLIFFTLFWLRQIANLLMLVASLILNISAYYLDDETYISSGLHLPWWFMLTVTACLACIVLAIVIFKFIPRNFRFTFILSGLIGGTAGFIIWLNWLGPVFMP